MQYRPLKEMHLFTNTLYIPIAGKPKIINSKVKNQIWIRSNYLDNKIKVFHWIDSTKFSLHVNFNLKRNIYLYIYNIYFLHMFFGSIIHLLMAAPRCENNFSRGTGYNLYAFILVYFSNCLKGKSWDNARFL